MDTFVAVVGIESIVAFRAEDVDQASAFVNDKSSRDERFGAIEVLRANGEWLWDTDTVITARLATAHEHDVWQRKYRASADEWHRADNPQWEVDPASTVAYLIPVSSIYPDDVVRRFNISL